MGQNFYEKFVGTRPWGQLTSRVFAQCRAVGKEFRRRYPDARIHAFSTDFPRTLQSAACFIIGFGPERPVPIIVRPPEKETLLPNYTGDCHRYNTLWKIRGDAAKADDGPLGSLRKKFDAALEPVCGPNCLDIVQDFRPLHVHKETIGQIPGLDQHLIEMEYEHMSAVQNGMFKDAELVRLASGRLVKWVTEMLSRPGHEISLLLSHDNMLLAFLIALNVHKMEWPMYASTTVLETADFDGSLWVRVLVNDEVRRDWESWADFEKSLAPVVMSEDEYSLACCEDGRPQKKTKIV